jgi:hypothetical protein
LNLQENAALNGRGCDILAGIRADADADFTTLSRAIALQKARMRQPAKDERRPHGICDEVQELLLRQGIIWRQRGL